MSDEEAQKYYWEHLDKYSTTNNASEPVTVFLLKATKTKSSVNPRAAS